MEPPNLKNYSATELLQDGSPVHIRAIQPADKQKLLDHFNRLSPQARRFRFFGGKRSLSEQELHHFTELDFVNDVGLVLTLDAESTGRVIAVARYVRAAEPTRAGIALAIVDEYQGRGIGPLLIHHLARIARANGIQTFEADVMGDNERMLKVIRKSGCAVKTITDAGVVHIDLCCPTVIE
jgi:RimJ/RimL family protein N-acetyltransferase